jgi:ATP synthase protein I
LGGRFAHSTTIAAWLTLSAAAGREAREEVGMAEEKSGPENSDAELKARLDRLSTAIRTETAEVADDKASSEKPQFSQATGKAMGLGFRVASELVAGVLVGGGIGWALDRWLGTSPFILIVMLVLGMLAGFWNVYKLAAGPTGGIGQDKGR